MPQVDEIASMQETRQLILEILRELGQATVDDIVETLCHRRGPITAVTVRHHLLRLQEEQLINTPNLRHRSTPGRPQHIYSLTEEARKHFPNNYVYLVRKFLDQLRQQFSPKQMDVMLSGVVNRMVSEAGVIQHLPVTERVEQGIQYLNDHGYSAELEKGDDGLLLRVNNCPYYEVPSRSGTLCSMDLQLISALTNSQSQPLSRISAGDNCCTYLIADEHS